MIWVCRFRYRKDVDGDITTNLSKLENVWNKLQKEVSNEKSASGNSCRGDQKYCYSVKFW